MVAEHRESHIDRNIKTEASETAIITVCYILALDGEATVLQRVPSAG